MDKEIKLKYVLILLLSSLVVGFLIGEEYTTSKISKLSSKSSISTNTNTSQQEEQILEKNIGEEIELASIKVKIKSFQEIKNIQPSWGEPIFPSEGAKFIKVDLIVTNISDVEFTLGSDWLFIYNQDDKRFSEYDSSYEIEEYIGYETLKPDIPLSGSIIFEVSSNSTELYLLMSKAGTSEKYKVELK